MIVQLACVYVPVMLVSQSLCLTALINALLLSFFRDTCMYMHLVYCTCSRESERERGGKRERRYTRIIKENSKSACLFYPFPPPPLSLSYTHMLLIGSVRLLSNDRNCFPFFVNAFTSAPADTKILSATEPGVPSEGEGGRGKEREGEGERGREREGGRGREERRKGGRQ